MSSPITTHVLDTAQGRPARGVPIRLEVVAQDGTAQEIGHGVTNDDGRVVDLLAPGSLRAGAYRITFETGAYFAEHDGGAFYPRVAVDFVVVDPAQHYHVPLLLSPFGYSTYRGS